MPITRRLSDERVTTCVDDDHARHREQRLERTRAVCAACGAAFKRGRWARGEPAVAVIRRWHGQPLQVRFCPDCRQHRNALPRGYLHVTGSFVVEHRADVERLLHGEADRAAANNPDAHVMDWNDDDGGELMIATTTEHLAHRLGHALEKTCDGTLHHGFSHGNKFARVWWRRD